MSKPDAAPEFVGGSIEADHLCVLVHGLWGNPTHMHQIAKSLRDQHPREKVNILLASTNSHTLTYDGIECGGERVCHEIEEELKDIKERGGNIKKLSIVGYSLGGLIARYAIGLLHSQGVLDDLECMNFTAFASPFLGVRTPRRGWRGGLWNFLGSRTLAASGRQLFGVDKFRDTGKPLLAVLADPKSIFISGLARFQRRTLYANIANDRTAVYYTTGLDKRDPYTDLDAVQVHYVKGYEDVVLDHINPVSVPATPPAKKNVPLTSSARKWLNRVPLVLALVVLIPIGVLGYFINAGIQTKRSTRRVREHEKGLTGIKVKDYRSARLWIDEMRERVVEDLGGEAVQGREEYLENGDESDSGEEEIVKRERRMSIATQPTLALAPYQFAALEELDKVGFRKFPVWIHKENHTHAAIVVRSETSRFDEGRVVLKHWSKEEFLP